MGEETIVLVLASCATSRGRTRDGAGGVGPLEQRSGDGRGLYVPRVGATYEENILCTLSEIGVAGGPSSLGLTLIILGSHSSLTMPGKHKKHTAFSRSKSIEPGS